MKNTDQGTTISVIAAAPTATALPIEMLEEKDGYVVGIRRSGLTTVPYALHLVCRDAMGRIVDQEGDGIEGNYGEPIVAYSRLTCTDTDIEAAIAQGARMKAAAAKAAAPMTDSDVQECLEAARRIIHVEARRLGLRRAILKLHRQVCDAVDHRSVPLGEKMIYIELSGICNILDEWSDGDVDDFDAIEALRMRAEEPAA